MVHSIENVSPTCILELPIYTTAVLCTDVNDEDSDLPNFFFNFFIFDIKLYEKRERIIHN